jgi:hypothetical protein
MNRDQRVIWRISGDEGTTACVMVSCCSGAELQVIRDFGGDETIVLRELYPDHASLYERAKELEAEVASV